MPRVLLVGSPPFADPLRRALTERGWLAGVLTVPAKPKGRGRSVQVPNGWAVDDRTVFAPDPPSPAAVASVVARTNPDAVLLASYGRILSEAALQELPRFRLNIHPSLLPRWRGAAPVPRTILAGDARTGVTLHELAAAVDAGPIVAVSDPMVLTGHETTETLLRTLAEVGAALALDTLPRYMTGECPPIPQPLDGVVVAPRLRAEEAWIDWSESAQRIERAVRAFQPWPVARTLLEGTALHILQTRVLADAPQQHPGTFQEVAGSPVVSCGVGALELTQVQRPGRAPVAGSAFLRGYRGPLPAVLRIPDVPSR